MFMKTIDKIDSLKRALEAQLEILQQLKAAEESGNITDAVYLHRLLGAGDLITREKIDMLLVD